jgi:NAD(P)-dependent dehydrogenase (short-subunit alcohol dehydrogenase family)
MNKVMLITGANEGIGHFMVKSWLKLGNIAVVFDVCLDNIAELKSQYESKLFTYICDVSNYDTVKSNVDEVIGIVNEFDVVIHNACKCVFKSIEEHEIEEYMSIFSVNYMGAVNITKSVLPYMKEINRGRICYTSSGVGITGYKNISGYASSKGAIESLAKCMVMENLDNNISFHVLHPPLTNTESSSPLPVPKEFKASAEVVGRGFIRRIFKKSFIIAPSIKDNISVKMSYRFPFFIGKLMVKMTKKVQD